MSIPEQGLGVAINDRLRRAAAPRGPATLPDSRQPPGSIMPETKKIDPALLDRLRAIVGPAGHIDDPADMEPYVAEWRGQNRGTPLVLRPPPRRSIGRDAACAEAGVPVVPQGGNTGLVGGSIPQPKQRSADQPVPDEQDPRDGPAELHRHGGGRCVLQTLQQAAADVDRLFPLSLGAEGTCQIGGNISANAGGTMTLRYGNTRDLVLGLEVVLPDGQIWNGMRRLRKNNTGYDLKHLFIGAEGTLGFITAAVLKLFPRPKQVETGFLAVRDPDAAIELLASLRSASGDSLSAFELMPRIALDFALKHVAGTIDPLSEPFPWYVLLELSTGTGGDAFRETIEAALGEAMEAGLVRTPPWRRARRRPSSSGSSARPSSRRRNTRAARSSTTSRSRYPASAVHRAGDRSGRADDPRRPAGPVRPCRRRQHPFQPQPARRRRPRRLSGPLGRDERRVHDIVPTMDGSISAEHGIGPFKREELQRASHRSKST